jgi:hypothetical protein
MLKSFLLVIHIFVDFQFEHVGTFLTKRVSSKELKFFLPEPRKLKKKYLHLINI